MKKEQLHLYVFPKMNDVPHSFFPSRYEQIHDSKTPDIIFINTRNNPLGIYRQIVTARIGFGWWEIIVPHCLRIISSHWQLEIGNAARRLIGQQIYPVLVTLLRGFLTSVGIRDTGYEKIRISYHRVARGLEKKISG